MNKDDILEKIKGEIEALASKTVESPDEEIFKSGFLDSLNVLNIIVFIEETFDIKINTFEVTLDTLGTLNRITDYVHGKVNEQ